MRQKIVHIPKYATCEGLNTPVKIFNQLKSNKMKKDKNITHVIFRRFKEGDIIALFPYDQWDKEGLYCGSYMHIGQHSGADYNGLIQATKPAKECEYDALKSELEGIGYNLKVIKRKTR
jgi:hypothetical protein